MAKCNQLTPLPYKGLKAKSHSLMRRVSNKQDDSPDSRTPSTAGRPRNDLKVVIVTSLTANRITVRTLIATQQPRQSSVHLDAA